MEAIRDGGRGQDIPEVGLCTMGMIGRLDLRGQAEGMRRTSRISVILFLVLVRAQVLMEARIITLSIRGMGTSQGMDQARGIIDGQSRLSTSLLRMGSLERMELGHQEGQDMAIRVRMRRRGNERGGKGSVGIRSGKERSTSGNGIGIGNERFMGGLALARGRYNITLLRGPLDTHTSIRTLGRRLELEVGHQDRDRDQVTIIITTVITTTMSCITIIRRDRILVLGRRGGRLGWEEVEAMGLGIRRRSSICLLRPDRKSVV